MASPQLEDGYTRIANELIDALCRIRLAGQECQIVWAVIRLTYGFGKKADMMSHSKLGEMVGLNRVKVARLVSTLASKGVLSVSNNGDRRPLTIGINKDYSKWVAIPKKGYIPKNGDSPIPNNGYKSIPNNGTHKRKKESKEKNLSPALVDFAEKFLSYQVEQGRMKSFDRVQVESGAETLDKLIRIDGYDLEREIAPALRWAVKDSFWSKVVLSPSRLRERRNGGATKFVNLIAAMGESKKVVEHNERPRVDLDD